MSLCSRPPTPDSPLSNSLRHATNTIDDLTLALTNFSRMSSPEPPNITTCCCGREECETSKAWLAFKAKMESRLVLSAEVGQALLERHEAYVRRQESANRSPQVELDIMKSGEEPVNARVADLVKENAVLEKRLTQALINNEIAEASNKSALQELQEARVNISRLSTQHARSVGWENRLAVAIQERDDFQQERDSALQRAKLAETRISSLKEKCAKLQAQLNRLREDFEMQRVHRQELSQEVLKDARQRLEQLQQSQLGHSMVVEDAEVTKVLESLVADNEALKRDHAELQNLLTEAREDLRSLQEEVEERRADNSSYLRHRYTSSGHSSGYHDLSAPLSPTFHVGTAPTPSVLHAVHRNIKAGAISDRRAVSVERSTRRAFEPLTPETDGRPLSPTDSLFPPDTKWTSFTHPSYPPSHLSLEFDESSQRDGLPMSPERTRAQKSLLLLTRSRGVQTDGIWNGSSILAPSPVPHTFGDRASSGTSHDGQSESSSLTDGQFGVLSALIDRVAMLLGRMTQADALTLTNRLKRQHLLGADVSHLSRSTVGSILHEANTLRAHFRAFLEDDRVTTTCTRRDLRGLFKLFKDMFTELGQMRVTLNDVILDPSVAAKVSEMALHPAKAGSAESGGRDASTNPSGPSWMAPLSKLLGLPGGGTNANGNGSAATRALSPPAPPGLRGRSRVPSRIVPKREAALSASAMTVNVEFSGTAVGRSVTSTYSAHPEREDSISILNMQSLLAQPVPAQDVSKNVMGIFAGAPRPAEGADPWVVIQRPQRGTTVPNVGGANGSSAGTATIGRSAVRNMNSRLSRTVDAVIDSHAAQGEEQDVVQSTLLERTLSRRGMSDSSIHTTFMNHGEGQGSPRQSADEETAAPGRDRQSVLQALSRRMQSFRFAGPSSNAESGPSISRPETPVSAAHRSSVADASSPDRAPTPTRARASSPRAISPTASGLFQSVNLSSWAAAALDPSMEPSQYLASSPREEAYMHRTWARERDL
ncbi:hypothetical protein AcW1_004995 [Taiwanofungus camphoratus]|nr:hypothetical protein AcW2_005994 [Antrodia cinnamomea]KAI0941244.1 hypothetical protein AcV7_002865 [Antrodia cinnamomea]KAI0960493.1 hypothetical protein AcW1_004995 [Antrodia cinnamomea]